MKTTTKILMTLLLIIVMFIGYLIYRADLSNFYKEFNTYDNNFKKYIEYLKQTHNTN